MEVGGELVCQWVRFSVFCESWRVFLGEVGRMGVMLDGTGNIAGGLSLDNLDAERCTSGRF